MKEKKKKERESSRAPSLQMTPMIDITFLLLVFFMLACKFKTVEGKLKAFLPKEQGPNTSMKDPYIKPLRIKLLWYDESTGRPHVLRKKHENFDEYFKKVAQGKTVLKVGDRVFGNLNSRWPDYKALHDFVKVSIDEFVAPPNHPDEKCPVIIDAREPVPWRHVVAVLNQVVKAGGKEVQFAAPENPY